MSEAVVGRCPDCWRPLTACVGTDGSVPKPKDLTLCAECGAVLVFVTVAPAASFRRATTDEVRLFAQTAVGQVADEIVAMRKAMRAAGGPRWG